MEGNTDKQHRQSTIRNACSNRGLTQAYQIRELAAAELLGMQDAVATDLEQRVLKSRAIKDLCNVWAQACERIRIFRGKPLPGSLKPSNVKRRKASPVGPLFTELPPSGEADASASAGDSVTQ